MDAETLICIWAVIGFIVVVPLILPSTRGYVLAFIRHFIIRVNSDLATAVIKKVEDDGEGWWVKNSDFELGHMEVQLVKVTLEVHPQNGTPYGAQDRFSANADVYYHKLGPGAATQVAISRLNPAWVAVSPKTIVPGPTREGFEKPAKRSKAHSNESPKGQLEQLQQMLTAGLITQQDYDKKKDEILAKM